MFYKMFVVIYTVKTMHVYWWLVSHPTVFVTNLWIHGMNEWMNEWINVCTCVYICVWVCVRARVCVCVCMRERTYMYVCTHGCMCVRMHVCIYVWMYACMHILSTHPGLATGVRELDSCTGYWTAVGVPTDFGVAW